MVTATATFVANSLLLFFISTNRQSELGSYRYLIFIFAANDIYYTFLHVTSYPVGVIYERSMGILTIQIPEMYRNSFLLLAHGFIKSKLALSLYFSAYSHSFPLFAFLFLYRALSLTRSDLLLQRTPERDISDGSSTSVFLVS